MQPDRTRKPRAGFFNGFRALAAALALLAAPALAMAQDEGPKIDSGDTAWILIATGLVLFMTIPGLALFYAGLVRAKNGLSIMMQCFAITALITLIWVIGGYSFAFHNPDPDNVNPFIGGAQKMFLKGVTVGSVHSLAPTIPETLFMMFQMTFAIITPALIIGAYAERMKFSAVLWFSALWFILVYVPVAHWVWGSGWLGSRGVLDFAGGTVVHINAGFSALVCAIVLGKRKGYPTTPMPPHSLMLTVVGASMLWVGWFGFNAGSAVAANATAGMAMAVTHIATATATLVWMGIEWARHGKPSVLGAVTGAVAGLVAITPAAGTAGPMGAIIIGAATAAICFISATTIKRSFGYDDSLDAFGVHGVGGFLGAVLTGVCCSASLGGSPPAEYNMAAQVVKQLIGAGATAVYTMILTFIILKAVDMVVGLRVSPEQETEGLDISLHDERSYNL